MARALYKRADVLVLDEATSALDDATEHSIMTALNAIGRETTVIMIAHRTSTLAATDSILVLEPDRPAQWVDYAALVNARAHKDREAGEAK